MNELLKLMADNKISMTGGECNGETIAIFTDNSDPEPIVCSVVVSPEDDKGITVEAFRTLWAKPAVLSIKRMQQRVRIEKLRTELAEVLADCRPHEDLNVYSAGLNKVTETFDTFFGPVERM